ncbi:MAG: M48 family metallopeptidase [Burkholderiales bacterium]
MNKSFDPDSDFTPSAPLAQALRAHVAGCRCAAHSRRLFTGGLLAAGAALALPAWSREGVEVGKRSSMAKLAPADQIEAAAAQQYTQMMQEAGQQRAVAPDNHPQVIRLRSIAKQLLPFIYSPNYHSTSRAANWKWEINLIGSKQINAFCMPGGKIAFYSGILSELQLNDDEVAQIMGHEIAHALREHARERLGKSVATRGVLELGAAFLGLGDLGRIGANIGTQLLTMTFGREDETEADKIGLDMAARGGYNPQASISLWQKMGAANKGAPPEWLSTHPSNETRIRDLQATIPDVESLYSRAPRPARRFEPPSKG